MIANNVIRPRICRQCGRTFDGGPRAWYCPACRKQRQREAKARARAKGKPDRPLGSIDICEVCGKEYVVKGARQRYCPACAQQAIREADRPMSRAWNSAHKDTYYPARNAKRRKGLSTCIVCGKQFDAQGTCRLTCSPECHKARAKAKQREYDARRSPRKRA